MDPESPTEDEMAEAHRAYEQGLRELAAEEADDWLYAD